MKNLVMIIAVLTLTSCSKTMDPGDLLDPTENKKKYKTNTYRR